MAWACKRHRAGVCRPARMPEVRITGSGSAQTYPPLTMLRDQEGSIVSNQDLSHGPQPLKPHSRARLRDLGLTWLCARPSRSALACGRAGNPGGIYGRARPPIRPRKGCAGRLHVRKPPRTLRGPAKAAHHTRDASTCSAAISTLSGRHGLYLEKAIDLEIMAADEPDPKLKASLLQIVAAHRKLAHETLSELAEFGSSWKRKETPTFWEV
jgi:hypothetical protein